MGSSPWLRHARLSRTSRKPAFSREPSGRGRLGEIGEGLIIFEIAMCCETTGMHDSFRYALVTKMKDLLAEMKIFQDGGAAHPYLQ
jgi:hypothetical protein